MAPPEEKEKKEKKEKREKKEKKEKKKKEAVEEALVEAPTTDAPGGVDMDLAEDAKVRFSLWSLGSNRSDSCTRTFTGDKRTEEREEEERGLRGGSR